MDRRDFIAKSGAGIAVTALGASVAGELQESEAVIYYITQIPERVQMQMRSVTGHYRNDFSKTTQSFYWMNHCEHCGMKQGDFECSKNSIRRIVPSIRRMPLESCCGRLARLLKRRRHRLPMNPGSSNGLGSFPDYGGNAWRPREPRFLRSEVP